MKHFVEYLILLTLATGCADEEMGTDDSGTGYFPLETGIYRVYEVREIQYGPAGEPADRTYEMMAEVVDSFPSQQGLYTYVMHRSQRSTDGGAWEPLDTWSVTRNSREVIVSEGNTAFVKMRFPVVGDNRWDGNAFNALGADTYGFRDIGQPRVIAGTTFANTVTVEHENNEDPIVFRDLRGEIYARGVGLVYREIIQLNYCTDESCLGQQKIDNGIEMKLSIKQYGKR